MRLSEMSWPRSVNMLPCLISNIFCLTCEGVCEQVEVEELCLKLGDSISATGLENTQSGCPLKYFEMLHTLYHFMDLLNLRALTAILAYAHHHLTTPSLSACVAATTKDSCFPHPAFVIFLTNILFITTTT